MKEFISSVTASITGIDGAGKSTVSELVTNDLGVDTSIAKISRPVYSISNGEKQLEYTNLIKVVDSMHEIADKRESKRLSTMANACNVLLQGRFIEPRIIKRRHPELVLGTRDYLIDPSVYSVFYSPLLAEKSAEERLTFFKKLTGTEFRDVIFFLTVPPDEAVARIDRRMSEEVSGQKKSIREKWKHMHEKADHLETLQKEYVIVLNKVKTMSDSEIIEIDTSYHPQKEVSDIITSKLRSLLPTNGIVFSEDAMTISTHEDTFFGHRKGEGKIPV